jgi:hypothetical protein
MRRLLLMLAWLPCSAAALQPLITDDTGTQGSGGNQVELAWSRSIEKEPGSRNVIGGIQVLYTRGMTDALDLYAGGAFLRNSPAAPGTPQHGPGNAVAGLKWRFHEDEKKGLSLALRPEIQFPASARAEDRGLGSAAGNAAIALLLTQQTGFGAVHANLALASQRFRRDGNRDLHRDRVWRLSLAPVFEVTERWQIAVDAGLVTNPHRAERSGMAYVETGVIYSPEKNLELAAGLIRDVGHQGHHVYQVTVGMTWRFR